MPAPPRAITSPCYEERQKVIRPHKSTAMMVGEGTARSSTFPPDTTFLRLVKNAGPHRLPS